MSPSPEKINQLAVDPEFLKLPEDQQKAILNHTLSFTIDPKQSQVNFDARAALRPKSNSTPVTRRDIDFLIDMVRPFAAGAAGAGAGAISGPAAPVAGPAAYAGVDAILQKLKSQPDQGLIASVTGMEPGSWESTLTNTGEQALLGKAGGALVGAGAKRLKAIYDASRSKVDPYLPTASQILAKEGHTTYASITKFIEDHFGPGSKTRAQAASGQAASDIAAKEAGKMAGRSANTVRDPEVMAKLVEMGIPEEDAIKIFKYTQQKIPATVPSSKISALNTPTKGAVEIHPAAKELDALIADSELLQKTLTRSQAAGKGVNLREDLRGYQFQKLVRDSTEVVNGSPRINPDKLKALMDDPSMISSNKVLFNAKTRATMEQFFDNIKHTQDKMGSSGAFNRIIMYGDMVALPLSLMSSFMSGSIKPVAAATGVIGVQVGLNGLARLLSNPKTGRLMAAMAGGGPLGVSPPYASKMIAQVLQGTTVALVNQDGTTVPFEIEKPR